MYVEADGGQLKDFRSRVRKYNDQTEVVKTVIPALKKTLSLNFLDLRKYFLCISSQGFQVILHFQKGGALETVKLLSRTE